MFCVLLEGGGIMVSSGGGGGVSERSLMRCFIERRLHYALCRALIRVAGGWRKLGCVCVCVCVCV